MRQLSVTPIGKLYPKIPFILTLTANGLSGVGKTDAGKEFHIWTVPIKLIWWGALGAKSPRTAKSTLKYIYGICSKRDMIASGPKILCVVLD